MDKPRRQRQSEEAGPEVGKKWEWTRKEDILPFLEILNCIWDCTTFPTCETGLGSFYQEI